MRTTSSLIDALVADVKPVRRLGPPSVRAVCWLLFAMSMLIMLRHVARLAPTPIAMMASLAVAAMTTVALSLFHSIDATLMILLRNFGAAVLFLTISGLGGQRLFGWAALKG